MKLNCPSCSADYEFDVTSIPPSGIQVKCYQCLHRFHVKPPQPSAPQDQSPNLGDALFGGDESSGFGFDIGTPSTPTPRETPPVPAQLSPRPDPPSSAINAPRGTPIPESGAQKTRPNRPQRPSRAQRASSLSEQDLSNLPQPAQKVRTPKAPFSPIESTSSATQDKSNLPQPVAHRAPPSNFHSDTALVERAPLIVPPVSPPPSLSAPITPPPPSSAPLIAPPPPPNTPNHQVIKGGAHQVETQYERGPQGEIKQSKELFAVQSAPDQSPELFAVQSASPESPELFAVQSASPESPELFAVQSSSPESPELSAVQSRGQVDFESHYSGSVTDAEVESANELSSEAKDPFNFDGINALFDQGDGGDFNPDDGVGAQVAVTPAPSSSSLFSNPDSLFDFGASREVNLSSSADPLLPTDSPENQQSEGGPLPTAMTPETLIQSYSPPSTFTTPEAETINDPDYKPFNETFELPPSPSSTETPPYESYSLPSEDAVDLLDALENLEPKPPIEAPPPLQKSAADSSSKKPSSSMKTLLILFLLLFILIGGGYWQYPKFFHQSMGSLLGHSPATTDSQGVRLNQPAFNSKAPLGDQETEVDIDFSNEDLSQTPPQDSSPREGSTVGKSSQKTKNIASQNDNDAQGKSTSESPAQKRNKWFTASTGLNKSRPNHVSRFDIDRVLGQPTSIELRSFTERVKDLPSDTDQQRAEKAQALSMGALHFDRRNGPWATEALKAAQEMSVEYAQTDDGQRALIASALANHLDEAESQAIAFGYMHPRDPIAQELMGRAYLKRGQTQAAQKAFTRAIKIEPKRLSPRQSLAATAIANGDIETANAALKSIQEHGGGGVSVARMIAQVALKEGDPPKAFSWIESLFEVDEARIDDEEKSKIMITLAESINQEIYENKQSNRDSKNIAPQDYNHEQVKNMALRNAVKSWPNHHRALSLLTDHFKQAKQWKSALRELDSIEKKAGPSASTLIERAEILKKMGRTDKSFKTIEKAAQRLPKHLGLKLKFADALMQRKEFNRAREVIQSARKLSPQSPQAILSFSQLLIKEARVKEAQRFLEREMYRQPWSPELQKGFGDLKWKLAQTSGQKRFVQDSFDAYSKSLELNPGLHEARLQKARAELSLGMPQEALSDLQRLEREADYRGKLDFELGKAKQALGKDKEAQVHFEKILRADRNHLEALRSMGELMKKSGKVSDAKQYFEQALSLNQRDPQTRYELGRLSLKAGEKTQAIDHLKLASEARPQNPQMQYWYARALEANNSKKSQAMIRNAYENAAALIQEEGKFDPSLCDAHYRVGMVHRRDVKDLSLALNDFKRASDCAPKRPEVWYELARVHNDLGDHDNAKSYYQKALKNNRRYSPALVGLAIEQLRAIPPKTKTAIKTLKRAIKYNASETDAYFHLCKIYQSRSKRIASRYCKQYLKKAPKGHHLKSAQDILRSITR